MSLTASPQSSVIAEPQLKSEFNRLMRTSVQLSTTVLSGLYLLMTPLHLLMLQGTTARIMATTTATTMVLMLGLRLLVGRHYLSDRWMDLCGFVTAMLTLLNCLIHLLLAPEAKLTTNFILVVLATGFAFVSLRWFVLTAVMVFGSWGIVAWAHRGESDWGHFGVAFVITMAVALIAQRVRYKAYKQVICLQWAEKQRSAELAQALRDAETARFESEQSNEQFEQALQCAMESERRYRSFVDNSQALVCTHDFEGTILTVNPAFARNLEYEIEELKGRNIRDLLATEVRAAFAHYLDNLLKNQTDSGVMHVVTKAGKSRYWNYQNVICAEEGQPAYVLGSAQDITQRVQAERELRKIKADLENRVSERTAQLTQLNETLQRQIVERERIAQELQDRESELLESTTFYEQMIHNAGEGIAVYDVKMRYLLWNQRMEFLSGVRANQLIGTSVQEKLKAEGLTDYFDRALSGETVTLPDRPLETLGGKRLWISSSYTACRDSGNEITGVIEITREVTARWQAEQELRQYTEKLRRSHQELEELAGIATHDLQEPLRKIRTFSHRLIQRESERLSVDGQRELDRIEKVAGRMQQLLDDLRIFTHVTTQAMPFVQVNLDQVIRAVVEELQPQVRQYAAQLEISGLPEIEADAWQMRQLFLNLVGNALKYRRPDVPLQISVRGSVIQATGSLVRLWKIEVSDNGIGFENKYLDRIFNLFERLHSQTAYEGTGVGLALCRRIVERHNGSLTAQSRPGEGSVFVITVPEAQAPSALVSSAVSAGNS